MFPQWSDFMRRPCPLKVLDAMQLRPVGVTPTKTVYREDNRWLLNHETHAERSRRCCWSFRTRESPVHLDLRWQERRQPLRERRLRHPTSTGASSPTATVTRPSKTTCSATTTASIRSAAGWRRQDQPARLLHGGCMSAMYAAAAQNQEPGPDGRAGGLVAARRPAQRLVRREVL